MHRLENTYRITTTPADRVGPYRVQTIRSTSDEGAVVIAQEVDYQYSATFLGAPVPSRVVAVELVG